MIIQLAHLTKSIQLIKYTKVALTVFYSGRNSDNGQNIEFCDGSLSKSSVGQVIAENCNDKARVMFVTECCDGGSIFDIHYSSKNNDNHASKLISFFVNKPNQSESVKNKDSHGIFTYYLCKIIHERPDVTPCRIEERMVDNLKRFDETMACDVSYKELKDVPLFE